MVSSRTLRVCRGVHFSITLKSSQWQKCSPRNFCLNLSDGAYFHSSWNLTACSVAKRTTTSFLKTMFYWLRVHNNTLIKKM